MCSVRILRGDCRDLLPTLPADSVHCVVTSPPYWSLRDYGVAGQIGLEPTYQAFIAEMVAVFREIRRVLRPDGTLWLNLGDSYSGSWGAQSRPYTTLHEGISARQIEQHPHVTMTGSLSKTPGLKPKDLCGIPWRVAFALQEDGWWLRQDIIWSKPNPMPESVTDRCTKAHEYLFMLTKSARYYYDAEAIKEPQSEGTFERYRDGEKIPGFNKEGGSDRKTKQFAKSTPIAILPNGRNKRSVWEIATAPFSEAHFATFAPALVEPCIKAGCPKGGTVLDPFGGAGTTGLVADRLQRNAILIELNPKYAEMAERRITNDAPLLMQMDNAP